MGDKKYSVIITETAVADLHKIDDYWTERREPERGEKYCEDLLYTAVSELSEPDRAQRGRLIKNAPLENTREILVFKSSYRIVYRISAQQGTVYVLRFWHSHRDDVSFN